MLQFFARRLNEAQRDERGFTLIELLVVVIIIAILAAIAIPAYISQRSRAEDASAQSTLRNAATAQESYRTNLANRTYATTQAQLEGEGFNPSTGAPLTIIGADADSYCMSSNGGNNTYYFNSATGEPSTTPCSGAGG